MNQHTWGHPKPAQIPKPTYWPAVLALGTILLLWGVVTSWLISLIGLALFVIAITGWIRELYHDHQS